jgi:transcriptional regulator with XRE-family HTH domain
MSRAVEKDNQTTELLAAAKRKHADIVYVLRKIRESYGLTQKDMALVLETTQGTVSKVESMNMASNLELLIMYASILGYDITVEDASGENEISRFEERQSQISRELSEHDSNRLKSVRIGSYRTKASKAEYAEKKDSIVKALIYAKHLMNYDKLFSSYTLAQKYRKLHYYDKISDEVEYLTAKSLSKMLGVSEKTIRRFDRYKASLPLVFGYAVAVGRELRLKPRLSSLAEDYGAFFLHNRGTLHNTVLRTEPQNKSQRG